MIKRALLASVLALACACGTSGGTDGTDGTGGNGGGGGSGGGAGGEVDMSAAMGSDAGMTLPRDMLPAYGCNSLYQCEQSCSGTSCFTCSASATMHARTLYSALRTCERNACYPHADGGAAPCAQGGPPSMQCTQCLDNAIKMGGACYMQYSACIADKP